jgi:hypothetical protein
VALSQSTGLAWELPVYVVALLPCTVRGCTLPGAHASALVRDLGVVLLCLVVAGQPDAGGCECCPAEKPCPHQVLALSAYAAERESEAA